MNPRAEKILKQLRELPMTDVREMFSQFHYAEEWVAFDAEGQRTGSNAESALLTCIREDSPVELFKKNDRWYIEVFGKSVGSAPDLRTAQSMAEAELELLGYFFPWRK